MFMTQSQVNQYFWQLLGQTDSNRDIRAHLLMHCMWSNINTSFIYCNQKHLKTANKSALLKKSDPWSDEGHSVLKHSFVFPSQMSKWDKMPLHLQCFMMHYHHHHHHHNNSCFHVQKMVSQINLLSKCSRRWQTNMS